MTGRNENQGRNCPMEEQKTEQTQWHELLAAVLEALLTPLGIQVLTEFPIMSSPPKADIVILRREGKAWSDAQKERLPDGIRQRSASHILIEFKYTESAGTTGFATRIANVLDDRSHAPAWK
ncbi:MAG: hypothetical protein HQK77_12895 [Desulfobacterales bacterium]|nr:hypothetical protein [Desulfobacterales bacterium]